MEPDAFWLQSRGDRTAAWVDHYWNSSDRSYRDLVVDVVGQITPSRTILEIGSHCGPNLVQLVAANGSRECTGVDYSAAAVAGGRQRIRKAGLSKAITLVCARWPDYSAGLDDRAFDVALSVYTLAYFSPEEILSAVGEMARVARYVVLLEPAGEGQQVQPADCVEWRHDYGAIATQLGRPHRVGVMGRAGSPDGPRPDDTPVVACVIGPRK